MAEPDPLQEASDPTTAPERLRELTAHEDRVVYQAVSRNPSVPEDLWRKALLRGWPQAWANPMAPLYVLAWTPSKDDWSTLEDAARWAMETLWTDPEQCSAEGKALIAAKIQEWWATSMNLIYMMRSLGKWAQAKGMGSPEHREVLRVLVLCVRTAPDLTDEERQALDLLQGWSADGEDRRDEAENLASSYAVKETVAFALDPYYDSPRNATNDVIESVEHERLLADLIRREMPLPPRVD